MKCLAMPAPKPARIHSSKLAGFPAGAAACNASNPSTQSQSAGPGRWRTLFWKG